MIQYNLQYAEVLSPDFSIDPALPVKEFSELFSLELAKLNLPTEGKICLYMDELYFRLTDSLHFKVQMPLSIDSSTKQVNGKYVYYKLPALYSNTMQSVPTDVREIPVEGDPDDQFMLFRTFEILGITSPDYLEATIQFYGFLVERGNGDAAEEDFLSRLLTEIYYLALESASLSGTFPDFPLGEIFNSKVLGPAGEIERVNMYAHLLENFNQYRLTGAAAVPQTADSASVRPCIFKEVVRSSCSMSEVRGIEESKKVVEVLRGLLNAELDHRLQCRLGLREFYWEDVMDSIEEGKAVKQTAASSFYLQLDKSLATFPNTVPRITPNFVELKEFLQVNKLTFIDLAKIFQIT